jgi:hypothetical protein
MHIGLFGISRRKQATKKTKTKIGDNNKFDVRKIRWCGMDWIDLAQDRD